MAEHFSLRWNNFHRNLSSGFCSLLMEDSLVDVTLAADGRFVQAHRLILSVCSPYFKKLFSTTPCSHPIVVMKDVNFKQLTDILSFMYQGEVNVNQEELADFLKTAELLQIRGLAEHNGDDNITTLTQSGPLNDSGICTSKTSKDSKLKGSNALMGTDKVNLSAFGQIPLQQDASSFKMPANLPSNSIIQTVIHQRDLSSPLMSQDNVTEEPTASMLMGVRVKEELPEVACEADENVDSFEYVPSGTDTGETGLIDAPLLLHDGDSLAPGITEKSLSTALPTKGAKKSSDRQLTDSKLEEKNTKGELPKSIRRARRQRLIAQHKIRSFLIAPKRSRRIAFARKMKTKRKYILKSGLSNDNITVVSKYLSAASGNSASTKTPSGEELLLNRDTLPKEEKSVPETFVNALAINEDATLEEEENIPEKSVSRRNPKGQDSKKLIHVEDSKEEIKSEPKRKIKTNANYKTKNYHTMKNFKKEPANETKRRRKRSPLKGTKVKGAIRKSMTHQNKKNIIVVIATKKSKSAVALARKINSPVRGKTAVSNSHSSIERTLNNATVHLRSSIAPSNGNFRDSNGSATNDQSCRHSGCLGCRGGN